jgi:hypothetical protein
MREEGADFGNSFVGLDLAVYDYARSVGNMEIMEKYADAFYGSEGDYLDIISLPYNFILDAQPMIIMPLGGELSDLQKRIGQFGDLVNSGMSLFPGLGAYQGVASITSKNRIGVDAGDAVNITGSLADEASKLAKKEAKSVFKTIGTIIGAIGVLKAIVDSHEIYPTNCTWPDNARYNEMVRIEDEFLRDLLETFETVSGVSAQVERKYGYYS